MIRSPAGYEGGDRIKRYLDYYQPSYGVMMLSAGQFSPASLFAAGEVGAWYDPSDFSTMFQDSTGVTPVTAVEQPVGLLLDKSKNAIGSNGAKSINLLTYTEQFDNAAWTKNAITVSANTSATTDPLGGNTADKIAEDATTAYHSVYSPITAAAGQTWSVYLKAAERTSVQIFDPGNGRFGLLSIDLTNGTVTQNTLALSVSVTSAGNGWYRVAVTPSATTTFAGVATLSTATASSAFGTSFAGTTGSGVYIWGADLRLTSNVAVLPTYQPITSSWPATISGNHASQSTSASRPVLSARVNQLLATATLSTQSVTTLAATYTLAFSGTGTVTATGTNIGVYSAGSNSLVCTAGTLTLTVVGSVTSADLRPTNQVANLPAYQAVVTSTNYDTVGFPYYLKFDGTDDSLATGTITPGVDTAQVFAGVRKLSDANSAAMFENNGLTHGIFAPRTSGTATFGLNTGGTLVSSPTTANSYAANNSYVLSAISDIANDTAILNINGTQAATAATDQGTGNYANGAYYIGRRQSASLPFNGNLYSLIFRFGANLDATTISNTETWVNGKTKAY